MTPAFPASQWRVRRLRAMRHGWGATCHPHARSAIRIFVISTLRELAEDVLARWWGDGRAFVRSPGAYGGFWRREAASSDR